MKLKEIINLFEDIAPLHFQESYDNSGLICGDPQMNVTGAIVCLDSTEAVIEEAIKKKVNLVIAHHPIVFSGIKKLTGKNYIERTLIKAIKNDIAIYVAHTNLDNVLAGVNAKIAQKLGLDKVAILRPQNQQLRKLVTFCPVKKADEVRKAIFDAGAGHIGNYSNCSFNAIGTGTFKAEDGSNPHVGKKGIVHEEPEVRIETIFSKHLERSVIKALLQSHPYEEVAYDIYVLENDSKIVGAGMVGYLKKPMSELDFLKHVKRGMKAPLIRHTAFLGQKIEKVAICGGSGSFLLGDAIAHGAQAFVSSDFKYHQFFDAENSILVADIGHFEGEQYTSELFYEVLKKKFPKFAVHFSAIKTNPINYI